MAVRANPNLKQRTLMMAGMAIVIIAGMVVTQVWQTYRVTVSAARRDVQQFTQILEANTDVSFQAVTLILDHAAEAVLDHRVGAQARSALADRFITIADSWSFINSVALISPDGIMRDLALRQADGHLQRIDKAVDASSEAFFRFLRESQTVKPAFYITPPGMGLVSGKRVIRVTKSVYDEQGVFLGVCVVSIALDKITAGYAALLPARYAAVDVFRRDSVLLASTNVTRTGGLTHNERLLFKDMLPAAPAGIYRITSSDGQSGGDLLSYRALQRYPIVIAVTADWNQFMEGWWKSTRALAASALIGILVISALTWWLVHRIGIEQATKQALLSNERRIMESQRLSGIGYYEHTVGSLDVTWSPNMYEIHGLDPLTFSPSQDTYIEQVVPEDKSRVLASWAAFAKAPSSSSFECRIRRADGELRHIRYSWKILEDSVGPHKRVFGVAQDVTAIRNAESIIRDDEERLRDIVECSSDYIWELDAHGAITMFSGGAINQFGEGMTAGFKVLTNDGVEVEGGDVTALQASIKRRIRFRSLLVPVRNAEAEVRWVRISGNPRFDAQGNYLGYRGAGTDVTELYRRQERDEAHRKSEALGRLASGMAHEINNLLQPIVIYANMGASQADVTATLRQYFGRIGLAAERSMMIVKNVLAFARQSPPSRENVRVLEVTRETVDLIGGTLVPGTVLEVTEAADDLAVRVDRTGLAQVVTNLLTNAAEALPSGGRIGVRISEIELSHDVARTLALTAGAYCRLAVEDDGPGIPADQLGKVFDPFFTTKPQGKGTGLGLSVVSGLAKSWGGTVAVDSSPGTGTCFTVYLPLAERRLAAAE